ncbi:hypothetical protein HNR46_004196 [Haloferula luteola]|uniref:Uncharacterized protein n=1 Tax=Haloferula luteola TaxID=595692 RepID=A0A840VJ89_9BACT|nr:hypothetical protein [Haloferula luteola]
MYFPPRRTNGRGARDESRSELLESDLRVASDSAIDFLVPSMKIFQSTGPDAKGSESVEKKLLAVEWRRVFRVRQESGWNRKG